MAGGEVDSHTTQRRATRLWQDRRVSEFSVKVRWSDLDLLGHVNNVTIVDWALLAQAAMPIEAIAELGPVAGIHTSYARPFLLDQTPVVVRSQVDGASVVHSIAPEGAENPYAVITIRHEPADIPECPGGPSVELWLRASDTDVLGRVTPRALFELCQEARVQDLGRMLPSAKGRYVVARVDLDVAAPFEAENGPLSATTAVTHVGRSSWVITTWFDEGRAGAANAVLVAFDTETQTSRPLTQAELEALTAAQA